LKKKSFNILIIIIKIFTHFIYESSSLAKRYRLKCGVIGNTWEHFETWWEHQYFFPKPFPLLRKKRRALFGAYCSTI
jgi:hypothetical protein